MPSPAVPAVHLYTDRRMLDHRPAPRHPERPERLAAILRHLGRTGLDRQCVSEDVRPATDAELRRVHTQAHLSRVASMEQAGGGLIEADTWVSDGSDLGARLAAGAIVGAVGDVVEGRSRRAFCAVRPPGHHARPDGPMGFCLYSGVAVAVADALARLGISRILVVDWDVHHGNGTQEIFYDDPRVGFFSAHRHPFYPGTGSRDETGTGAGLGFTRNLPLAYGIGRADYLAAFRQKLSGFAERFRPELIMISAGFDAHAADPVGSLGLEVEDFEVLTREILDLADVHAGGRVVSVLEGGYNVPILAGCVEAHLRILIDHGGAREVTT